MQTALTKKKKYITHCKNLTGLGYRNWFQKQLWQIDIDLKVVHNPTHHINCLKYWGSEAKFELQIKIEILTFIFYTECQFRLKKQLVEHLTFNQNVWKRVQREILKNTENPKKVSYLTYVKLFLSQLTEKSIGLLTL
jgi:hypothetical protein